MTFTQEDRRDKIRSQLKHEITHPTIFYEISKKRRDKLECDLHVKEPFPKKGSGISIASLQLAEKVLKKIKEVENQNV